MALRHTIPVEDEGAVNLLGKVLANGLSQKELNSAYDDVCKDYDKVQILKKKPTNVIIINVLYFNLWRF